MARPLRIQAAVGSKQACRKDAAGERSAAARLGMGLALAEACPAVLETQAVWAGLGREENSVVAQPMDSGQRDGKRSGGV